MLRRLRRLYLHKSATALNDASPRKAEQRWPKLFDFLPMRAQLDLAGGRDRPFSATKGSDLR